MCCCGTPIRNDQPGYSWDGKNSGTYGIEGRAPELAGATIVYDEMGRCQPIISGKKYMVDHHSHHYRLFKDDIGRYRGFVRHGGGTEEFGDSHVWSKLAMLMETMDSDARFVLFMAIDSTWDKAARSARNAEEARWRLAAADKRIKTRRSAKRGTCKVWIEEAKS